MSETIFEKDGLSVTRFAGGVKRGVCIQITASRTAAANTVYDCIQLTHKQVQEILPTLTGFAASEFPKK